MKTLFIIRGLPGSGKSTVGDKVAGGYCFAADDFFDAYYDGKFIPHKIKDAHQHCFNNVEGAMCSGAETIAVANTFTQGWESEKYFDLARKHGYMVHSVIVENTHGNKSVHNVPSETINKMRKRFEVNL